MMRLCEQYGGNINILYTNQILIRINFFRFEEKFRYDDEGLPKVWNPEDDIDAHFRKARDDVLNYFKLKSSLAKHINIYN